jgi:hypothetical protein
MSNEEAIRSAISRSISHDEIVHCEVSDVATEEIHSLVMASQTGEWDYSQENRDEEGREVLDVYSLDGSPDAWRIKVTFLKGDSDIEIEGCDIEYDASGVGHNWRPATEGNCPADTQAEIAAEIIDGGKQICDDYVASNGLHYRWGK